MSRRCYSYKWQPVLLAAQQRSVLPTAARQALCAVMPAALSRNRRPHRSAPAGPRPHQAAFLAGECCTPPSQ